MRSHITLLIFACSIACSLAFPKLALAASYGGESIKRYMFSKESFKAIETEFDSRKITFVKAPAAPAPGRTTRITGIGPSGYPTPFAIDHAAAAFHVYAERRRPQHPAAPVPYMVQDVIFDTPEPEVAPVGTLTYPKRGGPFPAVVLLAGSGGHDRNAGMSLHKTLLVLADHLTRQGFAVLRYDKRGVGLTGGRLHPFSTIDDYSSDALAAVRFLQKQPNIDPAKVGIIGHSEGAIVAAMVAAKAPQDVCFIVMLGGSGLPGTELKSLQDEAVRRADGMPEELIRLNKEQERALYQIAASSRSHVDALAAMRAATAALTTQTKAALEIPPEGIPDEAFEELLSPWFRHFLALDPRPNLEKIRRPVLALVGEKDLQVPPAENLEAIRRALKQSNPHTSVRQLPGLNHAFQTAKTGKVSEYLLIEETVAPSALALITRWMKMVVHEAAVSASP
jgi:pimeloyl-ACP methyl ester carboxylesterase